MSLSKETQPTNITQTIGNIIKPTSNILGNKHRPINKRANLKSDNRTTYFTGSNTDDSDALPSFGLGTAAYTKNNAADKVVTITGKGGSKRSESKRSDTKRNKKISKRNTCRKSRRKYS